MLELILAGGWLMAPIIVCSIVALIIIIERASRLQFDKVAPQHLREQLITRLREHGDISRTQLINVKDKSPLGDILATGLMNRPYGIDAMTLHMQNRASVQIHQLEKNINMLGTIGAIAPLLGLLGTVLGIINSFLAITDGAMQDPTLLAAGVSQALITTAGGMIVAIPALVAYRYYQRRIVDINAAFETEAGLLIQELYDFDLMDKPAVSNVAAGIDSILSTPNLSAMSSTTVSGSSVPNTATNSKVANAIAAKRVRANDPRAELKSEATNPSVNIRANTTVKSAEVNNLEVINDVPMQ